MATGTGWFGCLLTADGDEQLDDSHALGAIMPFGSKDFPVIITVAMSVGNSFANHPGKEDVGLIARNAQAGVTIHDGWSRPQGKSPQTQSTSRQDSVHARGADPNIPLATHPSHTSHTMSWQASICVQSHGIKRVSPDGPLFVQAEEVDLLHKFTPLKVRVPTMTSQFADVQADSLHTGVLNINLKCVLPTSLGALTSPRTVVRTSLIHMSGSLKGFTSLSLGAALG